MTPEVSEPRSGITDAMRALIGKEGAYTDHEVTAAGIRAYARAVGYTDPVFFDRAEAQRRGYRDLPAPPGFLGFPLYSPTRSDPYLTWPYDPNASINHPYNPIASPHTHLLGGGTEIEYLDWDVCAGDVLTSATKLESVTERYSHTLGGLMLLPTTVTTFTKAGRPVARLHETQIAFTPRTERAP